VNRAQAAFATKYCYAHKNDPLIDADLQAMFSKALTGVNTYSVRHRNYNDTMFELLMNGEVIRDQTELTLSHIYLDS
jgi:hypothetical protein